MSYKIEITETTVKVRIVKGAWGKVVDDPKANYEYAPDREEPVKESRIIYTQVVENLNLVGVISAVNAPEMGKIVG